MSENPDTASPQGPDPQGPDGVNAYVPRSDGQGLAPPYPYPDQAPQRVTKPSITQNPMTPRVSDAGPERVTPTSPIQGHPDDPIPWSADAPEQQAAQEVPGKPRRDVQQTEPARASSRSKDGAKTAATKPTSKGARSKREVNKTPSAHR